MVAKVDVVRLGENEYQISNNYVKITHNIVHVTAKGPQNAEIASKHKELHDQIRNSGKEKIKYIIDLNLAEKNSPEARNIWKELQNDTFTEKTALLGIHKVAAVLASFVIGVSGNKKAKFFTSEKDAFDWLNE